MCTNRHPPCPASARKGFARWRKGHPGDDCRGEPLSEVLDQLMRLNESEFQGLLASILLLDPDGKRLRHAAAPSLPEAYTRAIDGAPIGPKAGSCGTAAWRKEMVVVADILTDPLWSRLSVSSRTAWPESMLVHPDFFPTRQSARHLRYVLSRNALA